MRFQPLAAATVAGFATHAVSNLETCAAAFRIDVIGVTVQADFRGFRAGQPELTRHFPGLLFFQYVVGGGVLVIFPPDGVLVQLHG